MFFSEEALFTAFEGHLNPLLFYLNSPSCTLVKQWLA